MGKFPKLAERDSSDYADAVMCSEGRTWRSPPLARRARWPLVGAGFGWGLTTGGVAWPWGALLSCDSEAHSGTLPIDGRWIWVAPFLAPLGGTYSPSV